ncbi:hypothetical protein OBE_02104, partial [human gut metagenome]
MASTSFSSLPEHGQDFARQKGISEIDNPEIKVVYMDIYDCRSEYDFTIAL